MIRTQNIEIPNKDNCVVVTSVSCLYSHTFDASKMFIIDADDVEKVETQLKEKLMLLRNNATYNKRLERSAIVEVLKQNARMMLTYNVK